MSTDADMYDALSTEAYRIGEDHGKGAASWYFDGDASRVDYERVARGLAEGDPEIYDTFPGSPLSGEWAGDYSCGDLLREIDVDDDDDAAEDYIRMYEDGFSVALADEIERLALSALERLGTPDIDMSAHYTVSGLAGVAWYLVGYESSQIVRGIMVGDDRVYELDVDDLTQIGEGDYCPECGQMPSCYHTDDDDTTSERQGR